MRMLQQADTSVWISVWRGGQDIAWNGVWNLVRLKVWGSSQRHIWSNVGFNVWHSCQQHVWDGVRDIFRSN